MQIKKLADTMGYLRKQVLNGSENGASSRSSDETGVNYSSEVQPVVIRKTPKFPSRDRHLAIRRKKATDSPDSQRSEILDLHVDSSDDASSICSCDHE
jgi:hypothetical protein